MKFGSKTDKKQKKRKAGAEFRFFVFTAALAVCAIIFALAVRTPEKNLAKEYLPLARILNSGASKTRTAWALYGPVEFTRAGERVYTEVGARGIGKWGHIWLSGNISMVNAADVQDKNGRLYSGGAIRRIFNAAEKKVEAGQKAKILETYSFPFEFWNYKSCSIYVNYWLFGKTNGAGLVREYFTTDKKGTHYVAAEYFSNRRGFSPYKLRIKMIEGRRRLWLLILGMTLLGLAVIVQGSEARKFPKFVWKTFTFFRKLIGYSMYLIGPAVGVGIALLGAAMHDDDCVHTAIGIPAFLLGILLIPVSIGLTKSYLVKK